MILAAGLTPAWQQVLCFEKFRPGEVNRATEARWCASGKALNVGMGLHALGAQVQILSVIGGVAGEAIRREFAGRNIPVRWIESNSPTRICTTVLSQATNQTTELVQDSAPLRAADLEQFRQAFRDEAKHAGVVVISGSLPAGVESEFYRDLMEDCTGRVILDVRGPELTAALERRPFLVKPNREELGKTVGRQLSSEAETLEAMRELNRQGAEWVVVTHGADPVLASHETAAFRLFPPRMPVVNPIACGDCFAAGLAWGFHDGQDPKAALQLGIASAGDNLAQRRPARLDPQRVLKIASSVRIESASR